MFTLTLFFPARLDNDRKAMSQRLKSRPLLFHQSSQLSREPETSPSALISLETKAALRPPPPNMLRHERNQTCVRRQEAQARFEPGRPEVTDKMPSREPPRSKGAEAIRHHLTRPLQAIERDKGSGIYFHTSLYLNPSPKRRICAQISRAKIQTRTIRARPWRERRAKYPTRRFRPMRKASHQRSWVWFGGVEIPACEVGIETHRQKGQTFSDLFCGKT